MRERKVRDLGLPFCSLSALTGGGVVSKRFRTVVACAGVPSETSQVPQGEPFHPVSRS